MKAQAPHLVPDAEPGNREAVGLAYSHAAAWIRKGETPPPELAAWLADRLEAVGAVLRDRREKKPADAALRALGASSGRRGRRSKSTTEDQRDEFLAHDVHLYIRENGRRGANMEVFEAVAERCSGKREPVSAAVVQAAWKRRHHFGI